MKISSTDDIPDAVLLALANELPNEFEASPASHYEAKL